jgi:hypothetical protein
LLPLLDFSIFRSDSLLRNLGLPIHPERVKLVAWNRFAALSREMEHTAEDLQQLRPSKGNFWACFVFGSTTSTFIFMQLRLSYDVMLMYPTILVILLSCISIVPDPNPELLNQQKNPQFLSCRM